jgi:hypothetical protein
MKRISVLPEELDIILSELKSIKSQLQQSQQQITNPILSTEQLMELLQVSRRTIQGWRNHNIIEFSAVNGKFYYRLSAVERMLNNHLQKMEG